MPTVQDCINGLLVTYPTVTAAQALTYFNHVHREIVSLSQIQQGSEDVPLVAGQREYALNSTDQLVVLRGAALVESPTLSQPLRLLTTDWLDENEPNWRTAPQTGTPEGCYLEASFATGQSRLGLYPVPVASAVGGYPKASLFGSVFKSLIATDPVPAAVPSIRVYIEGMKRQAASDTDVVRYDEYDKSYKAELHATLTAINGAIEDAEAPRIVPVWMRNRRVQ